MQKNAEKWHIYVLVSCTSPSIFQKHFTSTFYIYSLYFIVRANLGVFFGKETKRNKDIKGNVGHIFHYSFFYPTMHEKVKKKKLV